MLFDYRYINLPYFTFYINLVILESIFVSSPGFLVTVQSDWLLWTITVDDDRSVMHVLL